MTLVIGHRGFSGKYPENTLIAIKKAVEVGADGVEFDIRATKDGKLVAFHDRNLLRMTGSNQKLSEKNWHEVQKLWVRGTQKIPLLSQVLKYLKNSKIRWVIIEVKVEGFEKEILESVLSKNLLPRVIISTSHAKSLKKFRELNKEIKLAYIMDNMPGKVRIWKMLNKTINLYSIHNFHKRPLSTWLFVRTVKSKGLRSMVWFLEKSWNQDRMLKLSRIGVDSIITDYPDRLLALLSKKRQKLGLV